MYTYQDQESRTMDSVSRVAHASVAADQEPTPIFPPSPSPLCFSLSPLPFPPVATLKASWRTVWNLVGWCTTGRRHGGTAKCPEPCPVMRLADKGRTWASGPILFALRMTQSPSGPCKELAGIFFFFNFLLQVCCVTWAPPLPPPLSDLIAGLLFGAIENLSDGSKFHIKQANKAW